MHLDEVHIDDYGPLDIPPLEFGEGVEVIYGPNESGKTLLVDAVLFFMTGGNDADRVGQAPRGYVRLDEGGTVRRLDGDETVLDRLRAQHGIAIGTNAFRNTFVVRSADSALSNEDAYYDRATDVVAESLVGDIDRVRSAVRDRGRITPTGMLIDQQHESRTRSHLATARDIRGQLETFIAEATDAGVPSLEGELLEAERDVSHLREKVERLRDAKRRETYEANAAARDRLDSTLAAMADLPPAAEVASIAAAVDATSRGAERMEATRSRRDAARRYVRRSVAATAVALIATIALGTWVLSVIGASLIGFVSVVLAGVVAAAVPGTLGVYFWYQSERAQTDLKEVRADRDDILQRARAIGIESDDLSELARSVAEVERTYDDLQRRAAEIHGNLRGSLGLDSDSPSETLEMATEELERRKRDLPQSSGVTYTEGSLESARSALEARVDDRDDLAVQLTSARADMQSFGDDVDALPFLDYGLEPPRTDVETLEGLRMLVDRLSALILTIEEDADNARVVADVLATLKEDEQRRVGELFFGAESIVSDTFSRITDGRYESVEYDEGDNALWVRSTHGRTLEPDQLSQSTFDQLYFAVRVAFAQELLVDGSGFLVLDDAFLAADEARLARQVEIVDELAADGWQILYFTAKPSAREQFVTGAGARVHTLAPLD